MFFKKLFNRTEKETPAEMLRRLKPELFDETGKTYNGGVFNNSSESYLLNKDEIELFPEIDKVFYTVTDFEENFFQPLCSFNFKIVNKTWTGNAHFVHFYKSQSDAIDANSLVNQYGNYNVTLFKSHGDRISFIGDKKAFQLTSDELEYWTKTRNNYQRNKQLQRSNPDNFFKHRQLNISTIIRQIGSIPMWVQSDETPNSIDKEEIFFVGQMNVNSLIDEGGWIFLFYCPQNQMLIQVDQWT
ncbi:MAG: hypothetical protein SFU87_21060 [Chitinophagaceae bacterium]|nr:hypothetical protein [Chitinophagaceae bacterium]